MDRFRCDAISVIRGLRTTPIPVCASVFTLAAAVGVNLAMFGLIDRALLSPPAHVVDPHRVVTLAYHRSDDAGSSPGMTTTSYVAFKAIRDGVPALTPAAWHRTSGSVMVAGEQLRADTMQVSGSYFEMLGARPLLGRGIVAADDETRDAESAAVLSHRFWSTAFGRDRAVLGRRVTVRGLEYTVAGVMPPRFSGHSASNVDVWVPFAAAMRNSPGWDRDSFRNITSIVARLAPDANAAAAATQAGAAIDRRVTVSPIAGAEVAAREQRIALWLTGVSVLVFIVGLANAGTLLLARGAKRRHEISIRASLGATRARLLADAWGETIVLSLAAVAVSLILASWLDEAVRHLLFPGVIERSGLGGTALPTAAFAGLLAALVAGTANMVHIPSRVGDAVLPTRRRRTTAMSGLLVVQTTLCVLLLAGAGLFASSFYKLAGQDFGMRMDGVAVADFEQGPGPITGQDEIYATALKRVRSLPGVQSATVIDGLPFAGHNVPPISVPGHVTAPSVGGQLPFLNAATPEFLAILDIRIVEGRGFTDADERGAPVAIVNQTMAREVWPGQSALGKCIRIGFDPDFDPATASGPPIPSDALPCREVIGVARDIRQRSLLPAENEDRLMQYFVPFSQIPRPHFVPGGAKFRGLLIRATATAEALAPAIRRLIVGERTDLPFVRVQPYARFLDRQMRPWQLGATLLSWFSALALGLAAIGLFAAFAHAIVERRREMAIRLAIGAQPGGVIRMLLGEALILAGAGVVCGSLAAVAAGRWMQTLLFETVPSDPLVLGSAAFIMLGVAAAATLQPARAASRSDPNALLRAE
jgi:predicted permease